MKKPAPAFLAEVTNIKAPVNQDKLTELRNLAAKAKKIALAIEQNEEELSELNKELNELQQKTLPDLFLEIGIDEISVPAEGNVPAFKATCSPFYDAGIPIKWDNARRAEAFAYLDKVGAGDLIKTEISVRFHREARAEALKIADQLRTEKLDPELKESVHSATLKSWLREQIEINNWTPDLEKIGGVVGRVVKIKEKR